MMKFSQNHWWKFYAPGLAWCCGLTQMSMVVSIEIVNLVILCSNKTVMEVIMNFLMLVIIAEFDDYYASTLV